VVWSENQGRSFFGTWENDGRELSYHQKDTKRHQFIQLLIPLAKHLAKTLASTDKHGKFDTFLTNTSWPSSFSFVQSDLDKRDCGNTCVSGSFLRAFSSRS
jgi:hypothetical protein